MSNNFRIRNLLISNTAYTQHTTTTIDLLSYVSLPIEAENSLNDRHKASSQQRDKQMAANT